MSTSEFDEAIEVVPGEDIEEGRLNKTSFIKPWAIGLIREGDISRRVAQVEETKTRQACEQACEYLEFR